MTVILLVGILLGYASGGRLINLANVRLRQLPALAAAVILPLAARFAVDGASPETQRSVMTVVVATSLVVAGLFLVANLRGIGRGLWWGIFLMAAGWLFNAASIAANRGMAVPPVVLTEPAGALERWLGPHLPPHAMLSDHTRLAWLSDVIRLRVPGYIVFLSVGDILLAVGVVVFITAGMRQGAPAEQPPSTSVQGTSASTQTLG